MVCAGIDYSLTSPAICIHNGDNWNVSNCSFYYLTHKRKGLLNSFPFFGSEYEIYDNDTHRYDNLSSWALKILKSNDTDKCYIEGYSFNSVGRVFQIAENTGNLKYQLWKSQIVYSIIAPTEIKKYATGKGNSDKLKMYDAFCIETGIDIRKTLDIINPNHWNPISDIVDAYYLAKFGFIRDGLTNTKIDIV